MEDTISSQKNESLCKVCGDKASGKHYGVASCDGCRGFFKRSIRRNLEYVCKENGRCVVDVTRRNQCQACRFKKCLQVNMKRDAVQHERAPRTAQTPLHNYSMGFSRIRTFHSSIFPNFYPTSLDTHNYLPQTYFYPGMINTFPKTSTFLPNLPTSYISKLHMPHLPLKTNVKEDEVTSSEELRENGKSEGSQSGKNMPNEAYITKPLDLPSSLSLFSTENIYESAAKLLFLAIKWARTIPSFLQLSYRDQSILLEESWGELFVLTAAQWSLPIDEAFLVNNAIATSARLPCLEEDAHHLKEIITRLTLLRVDHTEYACLKALVLFKAECRGLCEASHVELLQDQTHVMLNEYCGQRQNSHKTRFGKLLLTLPAVQGISRRGLEELIFRQTVGDVTIERLLGDLAKAVNSQLL